MSETYLQQQLDRLVGQVSRLNARIEPLEREVSELKQRKPPTPQYVPPPRYGPPPRQRPVDPFERAAEHAEGVRKRKFDKPYDTSVMAKMREMLTPPVKPAARKRKKAPEPLTPEERTEMVELERYVREVHNLHYSPVKGARLDELRARSRL